MMAVKKKFTALLKGSVQKESVYVREKRGEINLCFVS